MTKQEGAATRRQETKAVYIVHLYMYVYLESDLDGVKTQLGRLPLLEGLEDERHRAQVRHVQLFQGRHRLGVVLLAKTDVPAQRMRGGASRSARRRFWLYGWDEGFRREVEAGVRSGAGGYAYEDNGPSFRDTHCNARKQTPSVHNTTLGGFLCSCAKRAVTLENNYCMYTIPPHRVASLVPCQHQQFKIRVQVT